MSRPKNDIGKFPVALNQQRTIIAVSREHRRGKTDRLDVGQLK